MIETCDQLVLLYIYLYDSLRYTTVPMQDVNSGETRSERISHDKDTEGAKKMERGEMCIGL